MAQFGHSYPIKTYFGFGGLDGKLTMNIWRDTHHEFSAKEPLTPV
jgi:hypothetical protein